MANGYQRVAFLTLAVAALGTNLSRSKLHGPSGHCCLKMRSMSSFTPDANREIGSRCSTSSVMFGGECLFCCTSFHSPGCRQGSMRRIIVEPALSIGRYSKPRFQLISFVSEGRVMRACKSSTSSGRCSHMPGRGHRRDSWPPPPCMLIGSGSSLDSCGWSKRT